VVFSSVLFLFYFLPVAVGGYFLVPKMAKNAWLLLVSLGFYFWGVGAFVLVMLASIAVNYGLGLWADRARTSGRAGAVRWAIAGAVASNLAILGWFKYAGFALDQVNAGLGVIGAPALPALDILLPIGISFFTFQSMSYVFDVSRGAAPVQRDPAKFALYVAMFPQLVAGPIVRYATIADAINERRTSLEDFTAGSQRFVWGLIKKVVIADALAPVADASFSSGGELGMAGAWIGLIAYTLQIYFDFSAYSDMAIGLGRIFGFRFPENFARPYSAGSVTEFWRRWHITLSSWFRDYLYIPLGGGRGGSARTIANLWIVFLLTGLWHGAAWTFILWGAWHGALLMMERVFGWREAEGAWRPVRRALTLLLIMLGWVVFRAESLPEALAYYAALVDFGSLTAINTDIATALDTRARITLLLASAVFLLPRAFSGWDWLTAPGAYGLVQRASVLGVGGAYAIVLTVAGTYTAFLYFQF